MIPDFDPSNGALIWNTMAFEHAKRNNDGYLRVVATFGKLSQARRPALTKCRG